MTHFTKRKSLASFKVCMRNEVHVGNPSEGRREERAEFEDIELLKEESY